MRIPLVLACCVAFLLPTASLARAYDPPRSLSGGKCLDSTRIRGWTDIDERHILVDGGQHKYRIQVAPNCTGLNFTHEIRFKGDPLFGRVCGIGDSVITRDYPCPIERMELLSNEEYKQALRDRSAEKKARREARRSKAS